MRYARRSVTAVVLVGGMLAVGLGITSATSGAAAPAAHRKAPCHLWAVVNADGTIAHTGCKAITAARKTNQNLDRVMNVTFPRAVSGCAIEVTPQGTEGLPAAVSVGSDPDTAVVIIDGNGSASGVPAPFSIVVTC